MYKTNPQSWDDIYKQHGTWLSSPHEDMPALLTLFQQCAVKRVLDLGCGAGRHVVFLAQQGFKVCGLDSSIEALKMARQALTRIGLRANLKQSSMFEPLPYTNNYFDAIVCTKALNHGTIESIRGAIQEMERVLRPGGVVFIVVTRSRKVLPSRKQQHDCLIIAERTLVPKTGREIGVVHYQFNKSILLKEFRHFSSISIRVDSTNNYSMMGVKAISKNPA